MARYPILIVSGLAYGDEGKGAVVDALALHMPAPPLVVRHCGGPQAAHNVVTPEGKHHTFSQFGSATFVPGSTTHLSRFMLIRPENMLREEAHLAELGITDAFDRTTVAESAMVITPYHAAANQCREFMRGDDRHGSCGQGIGETVSDSLWQSDMIIQAKDMLNPSVARTKLRYWREAKHEDVLAIGSDHALFDNDDLIEETINYYRQVGLLLRIVEDDYVNQTIDNQPIIFEGAQGILLDEWYGFHPYTTWATTTTKNARTLLGDRQEEAFSIGVTRTYMTRHGAGPFVTEEWRDASFMRWERHNGTGMWQGKFRGGVLDLVALRYAIEVSGGIDAIAFTHVDKLRPGIPCTSYQHISGGEFKRLIPSSHPDLEYQEKLTHLCLDANPVYSYLDGLQGISAYLNTPVVIEAAGPTAATTTINLPVHV